MTLEERMAAMEDTHKALQDEVIALRALVTTLVPVIASSGGVQLSAAIDASVIRATRGLQLAGAPKERIEQVSDALAALREDMGETDDAGEGSPWH